jgi:uncharacterized protein (TIGR02246 family)
MLLAFPFLRSLPSLASLAKSFAAPVIGLAALGLGACVVDPHPLVAWPPPVAEPAPAKEQAAAAEKQKASLSQLIARAHQGMSGAYNQHDAERFASFFADDAAAIFFGLPDAHGRAEIAAGMKRALSAVADAKTLDVRTFEKGNVQVVESVVRATMTGDFMGIKATKKSVGDRRVAIAWFNDDGLVSRWHEYADMPGMIAQMKGAKDAPPVPEFPDDDADDHVATDTGDEDKLAGWFNGVNDAYNQDDPRAVDALDGPEGEATLYFFGGKSISGKALSAFHVDFVKAFPKAKFAVDSAWGIDGFVVAERTMTATHKGPFGDLPASNREVTTHFAEVIQPGDGGKIARTWSYGNLGELTAPAKKTK